ncbi:MAG: hypothetical protein Q4D96_03345 [Propionibacteriaceae bacterium]|nr:hypothetical protein [Propionibacteriaceae bacterium]
MARRPSKHLRPPRPLDTSRAARREHRQAGSYMVRDVPAHRAEKSYTCPGCQSVIPAGMAHLVAWPEEPGLGFASGIEQRRHWHTHCWRLHR